MLIPLRDGAGVQDLQRPTCSRRVLHTIENNTPPCGPCRQCAAGLQSIADVAANIAAGYISIGIAGGVVGVGGGPAPSALGTRLLWSYAPKPLTNTGGANGCILNLCLGDGTTACTPRASSRTGLAMTHAAQLRLWPHPGLQESMSKSPMKWEGSDNPRLEEVPEAKDCLTPMGACQAPPPSLFSLSLSHTHTQAHIGSPRGQSKRPAASPRAAAPRLAPCKTTWRLRTAAYDHHAYTQRTLKLGSACLQLHPAEIPKAASTAAFPDISPVPAPRPAGITSDNVAKQFNVSREEQDRAALASHKKAAAAQVCAGGRPRRGSRANSAGLGHCDPMPGLVPDLLEPGKASQTALYVVMQAAGKFKEEIVPVETIAVTGDGEAALRALRSARLPVLPRCSAGGYKAAAHAIVLHPLPSLPPTAVPQTASNLASERPGVAAGQTEKIVVDTDEGIRPDFTYEARLWGMGSLRCTACLGSHCGMPMVYL